MEDMMQRRTPPAVDNVRAILSNPVVSPMFKKLVLLQDHHLGLHTAEGPDMLSGLKKYSESPLYIAHPVDFNAEGLWTQRQSHLFAEKLVQPFKQVFRELYLPTAEEAELSESRRYSGYQIQVKQAAAALRSRGWTASYEEDCRKCFSRKAFVFRSMPKPIGSRLRMLRRRPSNMYVSLALAMCPTRPLFTFLT